MTSLTGEEEELAKSVECLDKASTAYGMETSAEKTKLITNNTSGTNTEIKVNGQKLEKLLKVYSTLSKCLFNKSIRTRKMDCLTKSLSTRKTCPSNFFQIFQEKQKKCFEHVYGRTRRLILHTYFAK